MIPPPKDCNLIEHDRRARCTYADDAADQAVKKVFAILGVDVDSPKEVESFRKSLRFGDFLRTAADKGMIVFIGAIFAAIAAALWAGFKMKVGS